MSELPEKSAATLRASAGVGTRSAARSAAARGSTRVVGLTPLRGGAIAAATWGAIAAAINVRRYRSGRVSGRQAAVDTAAQSAGVGLSASAGLVAGNAARALLVATTTATAPTALPFAAAIVASAGMKYVWDTAIVPRKLRGR